MPRPKVSQNSTETSVTANQSIWDSQRASSEIGTDPDWSRFSYLKGAVGSGDRDFDSDAYPFGIMPGDMQDYKARRLLRKHTVEQGWATFSKWEFE